jgi:putative lumazine-binding protein
MTGFAKQITAGASVVACLLVLAACGETVSTGSFKGESRRVAEAVADFQKDATASDQKKLCDNDLASVLTARLRTAGGCQAALKQQLEQVDALNLTVESIAVEGTSAQARVKSTWEGKNRVSTLSLVEQSGRWKISGTVGFPTAANAVTEK